MEERFGAQNAGDAISLISNLEGILVKQKPHFLDHAMSRVENTYNVYELKGKSVNRKGHGERLFICKQKKGTDESGYCNPYNLTIQAFIKNPYKQRREKLYFLRLEKPYKFTCCGIMESSFVNVYTLDPKTGADLELLGIIRDPPSCCKITLKVNENTDGWSRRKAMQMKKSLEGKNDKHDYKIEGSNCQLGFCCKGGCEPCSKIHFNIYDSQKIILGNITKIYGGEVKEEFTSADTFEANLPETNWQKKALIFASVLFLDYRYFEEKQQHEIKKARLHYRGVGTEDNSDYDDE